MSSYFPDYRLEVYKRSAWVIKDDWIKEASECKLQYEDPVTREMVSLEFLTSEGDYALTTFFHWSSEMEFRGDPILRRVSGGWDSSLADLAQANGFPELDVDNETLQTFLNYAKNSWNLYGGWRRVEWNKTEE